MRVGFWIVACLQVVSGYIYAVDDVRPGLVSGGQVVAWGTGGGGYMAGSARMLRVNYRGIHARNSPSLILRDLVDLGWTRVACNISAFGLCSSGLGHVFPHVPPRVSDSPQTTLAGMWAGLKCSNSMGKEVWSKGVYDVSACDVLDENVDVLLCDHSLYLTNKSEISSWRYWVLVLTSIVLVRGLGFNVQRLIGGQTQPQWLVICAGGGAFLLVVSDGTSMYVTQEDLVFVLATEVYILAYLWYHVFNWLQKVDETDDPPIFNLITGSLQLMVCRLYVSAETPYNPVLLVLLVTRVWIKIMRESAWHQGTLVLDALYLSVYMELGFMHDRQYLVGIVAAGYYAAWLLVY